MTEEQPLEVARHFDGFELRRCPFHVVAGVTTELPFEQAGNNAFGFLFGYPKGQSRSQSSVTMTAPVSQHSTQKGGCTVAFVLPAS